MLDLIPEAWDEHLSRYLSPVSRRVSLWYGGVDKPVCAQVGEPWRTLIGRRHCDESRKEWMGEG